MTKTKSPRVTDSEAARGRFGTQSKGYFKSMSRLHYFPAAEIRAQNLQNTERHRFIDLLGPKIRRGDNIKTNLKRL